MKIYDIIGTDFDLSMQFLDDEDRPFQESPIKKLIRKQKSVMATNVTLKNSNGNVVKIDYSASILTDSEGAMNAAILTINEKSKTGVFL